MNIVRRADVDDSQLQGYIADSILRQLLARRGIMRPEDLDTSLRGLLHYNQLQDIYPAADIIAQAIMQSQIIMIAGDYDIDGMSGTALGVRCLRAFGLPSDNIKFYVPSRYEDGYGLSMNAVQEAINRKVSLIITVDNGIAAFESIDFAMQNNIKVVVTDHHEIQDRLPNALAVVDPKRKDDAFASKNLCGVGVLFYVMSAVRARLVEYGYFKSKQDAPSMAQFLDLVTLGTVGDVMPLDSNNRRLIKSGIKQIKSLNCCKGLQALMRVINLDPTKINLRSIGFDFCPRFNASTRIKLDENPAIVNLLTDSFTVAETSAQQLEMCNKRRTDFEKVMLAQALRQMEKLYAQADGSYNAEMDEERITALTEDDASALAADSPCLQNVQGIVLFEPTFLTGLVGLVANRIKERYTRPCVIFGADVGAGKNGMVELFKNMQEQNSQLGLSSLPQARSYGEHAVSAGATSRQGLGTAAGAGAFVYNANSGNSLTADHAGFNPAYSLNGQNLPPQNGSAWTNVQHGTAWTNSSANMAGSSVIGVGAGSANPTGYVNPYRVDIAQYQTESSFLHKAFNTNAGRPNFESGFERIVVKNPTLEDVLENTAQNYAAADCDKVIVGSARSVDGIDLMQVFSWIKTQAPDIFVACGGHALAAGASIKAKDIGRFRQLFNEACSNLAQARNTADDAYLSDGELPPSHLCLNFAKDLEVFGPWGKDYEEPKFDGVFRIDTASLIGKERHLKLKLRTANELIVVEAIKFRASPMEKELVNLGHIKVRIFYTLSIDRYYQERLQLNIEAIEAIEQD